MEEWDKGNTGIVELWKNGMVEEIMEEWRKEKGIIGIME